MVITNGEPEMYSNPIYPLDASATWEECIQYCYNLATCVAVYDNNCELFEAGNLETITKNLEKRVAFKIDSTGTCPTDSAENLEGYSPTNTSYQDYSISFSAPTWTFSYGDELTCPQNFTLFVREKGPWCMQVIEHYACANRTVAEIMCNVNYSSSILSGLENQAEFDYVSALAIPIYNTVNTGPVNNVQYSYTGIWVDGLKTQACTNITTSPCDTISAFEFSDPTLSTPELGYQWLSGNPDGSLAPANEIVLRVNSATSYGMDDTANTAITTSGGCYLGYVCGTEPS
ncbi:Protein CBR-CLEC-113 [Caenorhabditis briggsae]|uniref:Protein CBR-CLEC-113 n=1 Tax=Caenorhabditis briggsae TaxID=6238 RepID=A8XU86_CAEBR|nr:Protein CBR-CLEC-113 [Caenorhabditis briggsae]CAP36211.1 Protein CBR-CLEC-113 [Caenorhabditis briggsae]